jgi:hypothetical protein
MKIKFTTSKDMFEQNKTNYYVDGTYIGFIETKQEGLISDSIYKKTGVVFVDHSNAKQFLLRSFELRPKKGKATKILKGQTSLIF